MWLHVPTTLLASVPVTAESNLDSEKLSLLEQSAMWKSKSASQQSWQRVWKRDTSIRRLSGLTSKHSTLSRGVEKLTSSLAVSLASPSQSQGRSSEKMTQETSGQIQPDLYGGLGHQLSFLENVPGILEYYFSTIRPELREMGYEVTEGLFSASETGAPHKRQRIFILADTDSSGSRQDREQTQLWASGSEQSSGTSGVSREGEDGEVEGKGRELDESRYVPLYPPGPGDRDGWALLLSIVPEAEPTFCRTLNGTTSGVDLRLRAIGNGVVPAVAARAFRVLSEKLKKQGNFPEL